MTDPRFVRVRYTGELPPHDWVDCKPGITSLVDPAKSAKAQVVFDLIWFGLPAEDRLIFHQCVCLNRRDEVAVAAMERIQAVLLSAMKEQGVA